MAVTKTLKRHYDNRKLKHIFPSWYTLLYGAACGILVPWIILLAVVLPPRYISNHWGITWVGFDIFECFLFALTALLSLRRSAWTALTSVMLGTTLIIDAWFDIMTARTSKDLRSALLEAIIVEIPLAILSFILAYRIFNYAKNSAIN